MTILKTYIVSAQLEKLLPTEKDAESVKSITNNNIHRIFNRYVFKLKYV